MDIIIIEFALSLLLTISSYLLIPLLLVLTNKKFTKKKLLYITIANGCLVFIFWNVFRVATNQDLNTNIAPAWLWSVISYYLMKKRLLVEPTSTESLADNQMVPSPVQERKTDSSLSIDPTQHTQTTNTKAKYCRKCGKEIDNKLKKCTGCGKQYFRWKRLLIGFLIFTPIISLTCAMGYFYMEYENYHSKYLQETLEKSQLALSLEQKEEELDDLQEDIDRLNDQISRLFDDLEFYHEHIIFCPDDGTGLYHKYGCPKLDASSFWAYNIEQAGQRGYEPCSFCSDEGYPVRATTREEFRRKYGY